MRMDFTVQKPNPEDVLRAHTAQELKDGANPMELVVAEHAPTAAEVLDLPSNLATVQKISSLSPIDGADRIELAKMEGLEWQCVVQKGLYKIGDRVAYITIDSICPESAPWAQFLKDRHFRVRTIRLKKVLSQGLIIPLSDLTSQLPESVFPVGYDITTLIGVTKYEKPIPATLRGQVRGNFPTHLIPKTDEERLQNVSRILEELEGVSMYATIKMDGTSATYINHAGDFHVCGRNMDYKSPYAPTYHDRVPVQPEPTAEDSAHTAPMLEKPNVYWQMAQKYGLEEKLKAAGNYAVQGEICGPGIQGNKMGLPETDLFIFNAYDIDNKKYLDYEGLKDLVDKLGLKPVPLFYSNIVFRGIRFDTLLETANSTLYTNNTPAEGLVFRPLVERCSERMGRSSSGRVSFKVVSNKFLEKYQE
jgi:RNA ligase (TIGR02306 family)